MLVDRRAFGRGEGLVAMANENRNEEGKSILGNFQARTSTRKRGGYCENSQLCIIGLDGLCVSLFTL